MTQKKITIIETENGSHYVEQEGSMPLTNLPSDLEETLSIIKPTTDGEIELPDGSVITGTMNDFIIPEVTVEEPAAITEEPSA